MREHVQQSKLALVRRSHVDRPLAGIEFFNSASRHILQAYASFPLRAETLAMCRRYFTNIAAYARRSSSLKLTTGLANNLIVAGARFSHLGQASLPRSRTRLGTPRRRPHIAPNR